MNEEGRHCLRLATLAAAPLGCVIGYALGGSPVLALITGLLSLVLWCAVAAGQWLWRRGRALRERSGHWLMTLVATGMPYDRALTWLEEMHNQLLDLEGAARRAYLANLVRKAPLNWVALWGVEAHSAKASRRRGNEQLLVHLLELMLAPDGDRTTAVDLLHATGLSRLQSQQPVRRVPALQLARRVLSIKGEHLDGVRDAAQALLTTREQAHAIARALRRQRPSAPTRDHQSSHSRQRTELARLRDEALRLAVRLHAELTDALEKGKRRPRKSTS